MTILCADDEQLALDILVEAVNEAAPQAQTRAFTEAEELLDFARANTCDIAFLDIEMRDMNGLTLAKRLKECNPEVNIVFVTGYDQYTGDAMTLRASGYVMKPATKEKILDELENLRHPVQREDTKRLRVQCFGNFEVFVDDKPLAFRYSKSRELFAYLIDRKGAAIPADELIAVLWEDKPVSASLRSQLRNSVTDLSRCLADAGLDGVLVKSLRSFYVDTSKLSCDYYRFLKGDTAAVNAYSGEYMSQYSWAEMTTGSLTMAEKV